MNFHSPQKLRLRTLLFTLLVALGPLQAQALLACEVMDMVMAADDCCCDEPTALDVNLAAETPQCCEAAVTFAVDSAGESEAPALTPAQAQSNADPPLLWLFSTDTTTERQFFSLRVLASVIEPHFSATTHTYLITQRLRI